MTVEQSSKPRALAATTTCNLLLPAPSPSPSPSISRLRRPTCKRLTPRILMRILLPLIHLLLKLLRLLLIRETQPKQTLLSLKGKEKRSVLIILESIVYLLVPNYAAVGGCDVHEFDPEGVAHEVVGEDCGASEARVGPSCAAGVGDVEFGDSDGVDFVGGFGDGAFDCLFFVVA